MNPVENLRRTYHRLLPASFRDPIGLFRRRMADAVRRKLAVLPYPPAELLMGVQFTPFIPEYVLVGEASARVVTAVVASDEKLRVLDFGCGSGRTLRFLKSTQWELHGCDVDEVAVRWCQQNLRFVSTTVSPHAPPTAYPSAFFDYVYAISVFTHFTAEQQRAWAAEMGRVLKADGTLLITTMGEVLLEQNAGQEKKAQLKRDGITFIRQPGGFNQSGAYHTPEGVARVFEPWFTVESHADRGLIGHQDVYVLRKRS